MIRIIRETVRLAYFPVHGSQDDNCPRRHQQRTSIMNARSKLIGATLALVLAIGVGGYALTASSQEGGLNFAPRLMHGMEHRSGMTGMGHEMMVAGSSHSAIAAEMNVIHELFDNHGLISRTVTNLPDGIRTVTESSDPRIARLIKDHVAGMTRRVKAGDDQIFRSRVRPCTRSSGTRTKSRRQCRRPTTELSWFRPPATRKPLPCSNSTLQK
jgi:hypothetical protein